MKSLLFEQKRKFIIYIIACTIPVGLQMMQIGIVALVFETVERQSIAFLRMAILIAVIYFVLNAGLYIVSRMMRISYMRDVLLSLRVKAFDKIMSMSHKSYNKQSRDVYISNLINDVNTFENTFFMALINVVYRFVLYISVLTILMFLNWMIGLIIFGISIIVLIISKLFEQRTVAYQRQVSQANEAFTLDVSNTFNGLEILKLNNIEEAFLLKNHGKILDLEGKKLKFNVFTSLQIYSNSSIAYIVLMGILIFLMYQTRLGIGLGELVLTVQLASSAIFPLVHLTPMLNVLSSSKAIYEKITTKEEELDTQIEKKPFVFNDEIVMNHVRFGYDHQQLLKETTFTIKKGGKYLIKGPSGAGKSTLMKILSQTIDDYQGSILMDGIELRTIDNRLFNKRVSYVYQDVFLFEGTLKDNITLFKDAPDETIVKVCHAAGMTELLASLPDGIHSYLSENGKNLSGGERQRVSIARALFKQSEILFIDEATSSLNDELGRHIEETILGLDTTVIAISHKTFEGISNRYDYVLELKDGYVTPFQADLYFEEVIV